jgi:hypothetical protein
MLLNLITLGQAKSDNIYQLIKFAGKFSNIKVENQTLKKETKF